MATITVIGSYVVDLMSRTPHMPTSGETVLGGPFKMGPGGKGGNQATAAARLGSKINMVTKVGKDHFGIEAIENFKKENINTNFVITDEYEATGVALILVDDNSDNMIVVSLGACGKLSKIDIQKVEVAIAKSDIVLIQLETNVEAVVTAVELAQKHKIPIILNPAPYQEFPQEILQLVKYITPNETEASLLSGIKIIDEKSTIKAAKKIYEMGVETVIITLGKKGCFVYSDVNNGTFIEGHNVEAIDSTGAGDAFNGGLAHALANNYPLEKAIQYANATAALSVTKVGTAPSMPYLREVNQLLNSGLLN
jgi:ribokinase